MHSSLKVQYCHNAPVVMAVITGGVIEAYPPSDSVTSITTNVRITPDGVISLLCTGDQICPEPFRVWGVSLPQCSVNPQLLEETCHCIAKACKARGIIGHFSINFVTFISPDTVSIIV